MPTIQKLVELRLEVEQGNLHGIVSLYALLDAESPEVFERDPVRVLEAT